MWQREKERKVGRKKVRTFQLFWHEKKVCIEDTNEIYNIHLACVNGADWMKNPFDINAKAFKHAHAPLGCETAKLMSTLVHVTYVSYYCVVEKNSNLVVYLGISVECRTPMSMVVHVLVYAHVYDDGPHITSCLLTKFFCACHPSSDSYWGVL